MKLKHALMVSALGFCNIFCICNPRVYSPPSRLWSVETPALLEPDDQSLSLAGGTHFGYCGFDFNAYSGTAIYRRGLTNNLEGSAGISFIGISPQEYSIDFVPVTGSVRAAVKYNPSSLKRFWALRSGAGLGFSPVGEYVTGDAGLIIGFDNPWLTPFVSGGGYISQPFFTRVVDFGVDEEGGGSADEAELTYGWEFGGGFRIGPFDFINDGPSVAIHVLGAWTNCTSPNHRESDSPISIGGGLEFFFKGGEK